MFKAFIEILVPEFRSPRVPERFPAVDLCVQQTDSHTIPSPAAASTAESGLGVTTCVPAAAAHAAPMSAAFVRGDLTIETAGVGTSPMPAPESPPEEREAASPEDRNHQKKQRHRSHRC